jgi:hypothetical protein
MQPLPVCAQLSIIQAVDIYFAVLFMVLFKVQGIEFSNSQGFVRA